VAGAELEAPEVLAEVDATAEDAAAFTVPGLFEWCPAWPTRKATAPTASTTTAATAINQLRRDERGRWDPPGGRPR